MAKRVSYEHFKILMKKFEVGTKLGHNWVENRLFGVGAEGKCRAKLEESENKHLRARNGQKTRNNSKCHESVRAYCYEFL